METRNFKMFVMISLIGMVVNFFVRTVRFLFYLIKFIFYLNWIPCRKIFGFYPQQFVGEKPHGYILCIGNFIIKIYWYYDDIEKGWCRTFQIALNDYGFSKILKTNQCGNQLYLVNIGNGFWRRIWRNIKNLNPVRVWKKLNLEWEMIKLDERYSSICNDPMCGCPGDFAEDWDRKSRRLMYEYGDI